MDFNGYRVTENLRLLLQASLIPRSTTGITTFFFGFLSSALLATGVEGEQYPRKVHSTAPESVSLFRRVTEANAYDNFFLTINDQ